MARAAALEQRILRLLGERDPEGRKHVVRLLRTFDFRGHVCMVFEPMVRASNSSLIMHHAHCLQPSKTCCAI
jgi:hypothetical protein